MYNAIKYGNILLYNIISMQKCDNLDPSYYSVIFYIIFYFKL